MLHSEISQLEGALQRHRIRTLTDEIALLERESLETQAASDLASRGIQAASQNLEGVRLRREATQLEFAGRSAEVQKLQGEALALRERASAADANLIGIERETNALKLEGQNLANAEPPIAPQAPEDQIPALEAALEGARAALRNAERLELQARKNYAGRLCATAARSCTSTTCRFLRSRTPMPGRRRMKGSISISTSRYLKC